MAATIESSDPRESAARALCEYEGVPEDILFEDRPMWMSYLEQVDVILNAIEWRPDTAASVTGMTSARFKQCLELLHWDTEMLASILGCNVSLTEACLLGLEEIPSDLAVWLDTLAQAHEVAESCRPANVKGKLYIGLMPGLRP